MLTLTEVLLFLTIFLFSLLYVCNRSPKGFPPGPWGLPLVGYLPFLGRHPFKTLVALRKKYGDVMSVPIGMNRLVVLNDANDIREAWKEEVFSGRPQSDVYRAWSGAGTESYHGILFNDGPDWSEQRRFTLRHLKEFGFGKQSMESLIQHEILLVCESLDEKVGEPVAMDRFFDLAITNSLWTIVASERFEHGDLKLSSLLCDVMDSFVAEPTIGILNQCTFIMKWFPNLLGWNRMMQSMENVHKFTREVVEEHLKTMQEGVPRDFIDVYLEEIKQTTNPNSSFYGQKGERSLMVTLLDLFIAGTETTGTALMWIFRLLALHPDKQKKIQKEVDEIAGSDPQSPPGLHHRKRMCYLEAFIMEVMRFSGFVPTGSLHCTRADVEFKGYYIPKGTTVISNLYQALHDPHYWDHPEKFSPERFLDSNGQLKHNSAFLIFGHGKRLCPGETLARIQIFLFCAILLQRFHFSTIPGDFSSLEPARVGIITYLQPFHLLVTRRKTCPCSVLSF